MYRWLRPFCFTPLRIYKFAAVLAPICALISMVCFTIGVPWSLWWAPTDGVQHDAYRIIYVHVPAAFMSLAAYMVLAMMSMSYYVWHIKWADYAAHASARIGFGFTLMALITGSIWGKPMWGAYWVWDARLTSELVLAFLYAGYLALRYAIIEPKRQANAASLLAIVGVVNVPIVHYSVNWWATLHQGPTLSELKTTHIDSSMLWPLLNMLLAFACFYGYYILRSIQYQMVIHTPNVSWLKDDRMRA